MKHLFSMSVLCLLLAGLSWEVDAFSEEDLKKLKATGNCVQCDLSGADLWSEDLSGADLTQANLAKANLTKTNLTKAILIKADLTEAHHLYGANLTGADLPDANLIRAIFCGTTMQDGTTDNSGC